MISILVQDTKSFMLKLFKENMFDDYYVPSVEIISFANFEISTKRSPCTWQVIRPYVHNIIKGNKTPKHIKIIFSLNKEESEKLQQGCEFFINMYFNEGALYFTTGTSSKTFSLNKTYELLWEDFVKKLFANNLITFTLME